MLLLKQLYQLLFLLYEKQIYLSQQICCQFLKSLSKFITTHKAFHPQLTSLYKMGAQNQPISTETQSQNHQQTSASRHPRFTQANIVKSKDENFYFEVSQSISNLSKYTQWEKKITQLKKKIGPQSLYLPVECQYQQQGFCGSSGTLKFKFQYFAFLLDEQIMNRQSQNQPFQQKQLWFLLYILAQTAAQLHKVDFLVGDIHPKNIFINHAGDISVYSMHSFPQDFTNFQKVVYFKQTNYLPPEGVNDIKTGKQTPSYDEKLGQSFSVGLTILNAIFLTDFSFLYDKMERFNEIAFLKIMSTLKEYQISEKLKNVVSSLVQINPQKRLTCIELCEYLSPYQKQIFQLEQFQIVNDLITKSKSQRQQSPTKSADKFQSESKRQSFSKTISLHGSTKKKSAQKTPKMTINSNEATQSKGQSTLNKIFTQKLLPFNHQNESPFKQPSFDTLKNLQKPSETIITDTKSQSNKQFSNINIQNNHITNNNFIGKVQIQPAKQQKPRMTFKTGSLFQRQKSSTSVFMNENLYQAKINANIVQSRKMQYTETIYQNNSQIDSFKKNQYVPSTNISSESKDQYNDFLKSIQKQIQESRKMFPDSMK